MFPILFTNQTVKNLNNYYLLLNGLQKKKGANYESN